MRTSLAQFTVFSLQLSPTTLTSLPCSYHLSLSAVIATFLPNMKEEMMHTITCRLLARLAITATRLPILCTGNLRPFACPTLSPCLQIPYVYGGFDWALTTLSLDWLPARLDRLQIHLNITTSFAISTSWLTICDVCEDICSRCE